MSVTITNSNARDVKVLSLGDGRSFNLTIPHMLELRNALNTWHEEREANRWVAIQDPSNPACYIIKRGLGGPTAARFFQAICPEAFPLASHLANQLNELEAKV